ncbi:MAG: LexA family transcriptional regulator [Prevotella sp.]|nr:LexA family transcriptional regulator [Prevotella sp.]
MTVKDRIKAFCKAEKTTVSAFEKSIGVSNGYVNAISRSIGIDNLNTIIEIYSNLNIEWLLTGRGEMYKPNVPPRVIPAPLATDGRPIYSDKDIENFRITQEIGQGKPYFDVDFLGGFSEIINSQTAVPACNIIVPGFEKATLWCNVTGHSMEPKINHGDIIALRECTIDDIQYGEIYAVVLDTLRTIKIIRRGTTPDVLRYVPINPDFDDQEFPITRILHIFEVLGSIARFF